MPLLRKISRTWSDPRRASAPGTRGDWADLSDRVHAPDARRRSTLAQPRTDESGCAGNEYWHRGLLDNGYGELQVASDHVLAIDSLPAIHQDPFGRVLTARATIEGIPLLTTDLLEAWYPGPIQTG